MNTFRYKFPHDIKNVTPVQRYETIDYTPLGYRIPADSHYTANIVTSYEIELRIADRFYEKLSEYVNEKLELDEFIRYDPVAGKLYDELLTYYYLKK